MEYPSNSDFLEEVQEPEEKEWDEEFDENEEPSAIDSLLENSETLLEQVSALNKIHHPDDYYTHPSFFSISSVSIRPQRGL